MAFMPARGSRLDPAFLRNIVLKNSLTFSIGECVKSITTGFCEKAGAGAPIAGIVIGFQGPNGTLLQPTYVTKSTTAYPMGTSSVTSASDNETVGGVMAIVSCDPTSKWSAEVNGTIGTTAVSNLPGSLIDVDSANTNYGRVLETTNTRTAGTAGNFFNWGTDPEDSTRLLVTLACSEMVSERS